MHDLPLVSNFISISELVVRRLSQVICAVPDIASLIVLAVEPILMVPGIAIVVIVCASPIYPFRVPLAVLVGVPVEFRLGIVFHDGPIMRIIPTSGICGAPCSSLREIVLSVVTIAPRVARIIIRAPILGEVLQSVVYRLAVQCHRPRNKD